MRPDQLRVGMIFRRDPNHQQFRRRIAEITSDRMMVRVDYLPPCYDPTFSLSMQYVMDTIADGKWTLEMDPRAQVREGL